MSFVPDIIKEASRSLRANMTEVEKVLWDEIKERKVGYKFLRQKPMYMFTESNGQDRFIVPDFYCAEKKLIIEVDGSIHNQQDILNLDSVKQELLSGKGLHLLRIKNEDIMNNIDFVLQIINNQLSK